MNTASLIEQNCVQIKEIIHLSWNQPEGLSKIMTGQPLTSIVHSEQATPAPVIAAYRFRVAGTGNKIILLSNDPLYTSDYSSSLDFLLCDIENKTVRKTGIPRGDDRVEKSEVVDFLLSEDDSLYLLERFFTKQKSAINRLCRVNSEGKTIWQTEANVKTDNSEQSGLLFGKCTAILKGRKDAIFLRTETQNKSFVLKINAETGKAETWLALDIMVPKIFVDDDLNIHYVAFIKETNNRAYISHDSAKAKREIRYAGTDAYALLAFPAATDICNHVYCAQGLSFSCLSPELSVKWTFSVNNIAFDGGRLLTSQFNESGKKLAIHEWHSNGRLAGTINLRFDLPDLRLGKLSGVANTGDWVIETYHGKDKTFWKYNTKSRSLDKVSETPQFNEFHLQAAASWQVDTAGNLLIPVSSTEKFRIIKVEIAPGP